MTKTISIGMVMAAAFAPAHALESLAGRVTLVETTYMPAVIQFQMDAGSGTCPAGSWLKWQKADLANNKATYAALVVAAATGRRVTFLMNDGDANCVGQFLYLLAD